MFKDNECLSAAVQGAYLNPQEVTSLIPHLYILAFF